jgi:hypothetical protein
MKTVADTDEYRINEYRTLLLDRSKLEAELIDRVNKLRLSNEESLYQAQVDYLASLAGERLKKEQEVNAKLIRLGFDATELEKINRIKAFDDELNASEKRIKALEEAKKNASGDELAELNEKLKIELENQKTIAEERENLEKQFNKETTKAYEARKKLEERDAKKKAKDNAALAKQAYTAASDVVFGLHGAKKEEAIDKLMDSDPNMTKEKAEAHLKAARAEKAISMAGDFLKQLESTMADVAKSQTEIDTRLQGSKNKKTMGSYWRYLE